MAYSLNRVQLLGRVGKEPECRTFQNGAVSKFSFATSEKWKDKESGDWKESTDWHTVVVWAPRLQSTIKNHVKKGSRLLIEGKLQTRKWTDRDGRDHYDVEVVVNQFNGQLWLLDPVTKAQRPGAASAEGDSGSWGTEAGATEPDSGFGNGADAGFGKTGGDFDSDIPFVSRSMSVEPGLARKRWPIA